MAQNLLDPSYKHLRDALAPLVKLRADVANTDDTRTWYGTSLDLFDGIDTYATAIAYLLSVEDAEFSTYLLSKTTPQVAPAEGGTIMGMLGGAVGGVFAGGQALVGKLANVLTSATPAQLDDAAASAAGSSPAAVQAMAMRTGRPPLDTAGLSREDALKLRAAHAYYTALIAQREQRIADGLAALDGGRGADAAVRALAGRA